MAIRSRENLIGAWFFVVGIILAVLVGMFSQDRINPWVLMILAILGLLVGFFVGEKDVRTFLLASVSLVVVTYVGLSSLILNAAISGIEVGRMVSTILGALIYLFVPATVVVVIKTVFSIASN